MPLFRTVEVIDGEKRKYSFMRDKRGRRIKQGEYSSFNLHFNKISCDGFYWRGRKHGFWTAYDCMGRIAYCGAYKNGSEEGYWCYYDDGILKKVGEYRNGEMEGEWRYYFDSKRVLVGNFVAGSLVDGEFWSDQLGVYMKAIEGKIVDESGEIPRDAGMTMVRVAAVAAQPTVKDEKESER